MEDTYQPLAILQPAGFPRGLLVGIDAGLSIHFEERPQGVAGWRAVLQDEPAEGAETLVMAPSPSLPPTPPTLPTPPTPPSAPTVLAAAPRGRGRGRWIAPVAGVALLAMAGAYYVFAPTLVPVSAPRSAAPPEQVAAASSSNQEPARPPPTVPGEAAEAALKLTMAERQRIQVALTSLGFDTRGSDGTFGPRSREMIAAWQRAQKHPATGYLTAAGKQALLREGQPTPPTDQPQSEPEMEVAVPPPPPVTLPAAAPPAITSFYGGSLSGSATGGGSPSLAPLQAELSLAGRQLTGRLVHPVCGTLPVSLVVDPAGAVSGNLRLYEAGGGCAINAASASGRLGGGTLTLDLHSADVSFRGTLPSRTERSPGGPAPRSGLRSDVP
jgi:peptidoglycan hydrolase-like protein with peptidoglycan-binding domain